MHVSRRLNKPYYAFRPSQLVRRARWRPGSQCEGEVLLPWGLPIRVRTGDSIGDAIARTGIYDLCVTEILYRLVDRGEVAVDAGANIGYMTSILATRVGEGGRVEAFEPHPELFAELSRNVSHWCGPRLGLIRLHELALSNRSGIGLLHVSEEFEVNRGTAALTADHQEGDIPVALVRLDEVVQDRVGVMKLDVERHELSALEGGDALFSDWAIRDVVFEEHEAPPTNLTCFLESRGFTIFSIHQGFLGPRLGPLLMKRDSWDPPSYLATRDPARVIRRVRRRGWACLRRRLAYEPYGT